MYKWQGQMKFTTDNYVLEMSVKMRTACNCRLWRGTLQQDARPAKLDGDNPCSWQVPFSRVCCWFVVGCRAKIVSVEYVIKNSENSSSQGADKYFPSVLYIFPAIHLPCLFSDFSASPLIFP